MEKDVTRVDFSPTSTYDFLFYDRSAEGSAIFGECVAFPGDDERLCFKYFVLPSETANCTPTEATGSGNHWRDIGADAFADLPASGENTGLSRRYYYRYGPVFYQRHYSLF